MVSLLSSASLVVVVLLAVALFVLILVLIVVLVVLLVILILIVLAVLEILRIVGVVELIVLHFSPPRCDFLQEYFHEAALHGVRHMLKRCAAFSSAAAFSLFVIGYRK